MILPSPLTTPLPSQEFFPYCHALGEWTEHLHFAYDLVAQLKPEIVVELGTDRGESYFTFCQSALEIRTGTRCYSINSWLDRGHPDETTFNEVSAHNQESYWSFSHLLRSSFDDALSFFGDSSIDILHIDNVASEEAIRLTLERWLPKLRQGGILLLHNVLVRRRGFGVWLVWGELSAQGQSYTFEDGSGLGVWQKPKAWATPPLLRSLLSPGAERDALATYYTERADDLHEAITQQWSDGTIRKTTAATQTTIQLFIPVAGVHREQDSMRVRIGHNEWIEVTIPIPSNSCNGPLRIDFLSALTTIDIAEIELHEEADFAAIYYDARTPKSFRAIRVTGDAKRLDHAGYLRFEVSGINPQLHLPPSEHTGSHPSLLLRLRVRVHTGGLPD